MTSQIASRWVKAAFLAVLGIVILLYTEKFVNELRNAFADDVNFDLTWDLLRILLWILVAWLLVDAVLTIVLSLTEQKYSPADLMRKLEEIEKKIGQPAKVSKKPEPAVEPVVPRPPEDEVPPPPKE